MQVYEVEDRERRTLDLEWLELILRARLLGLSIEEVRTFLQESRSAVRKPPANAPERIIL